MKPYRTTIAAIAILAAALPLFASHADAQNLSTVLSEMDAASKRFESVQANVQYDIYTRVVHDDSLQTGSLYVARAGSGYAMGAVVYDLGPGGKAASTPSKVVTLEGSTLRMYTPGTRQVDLFKAGANQARYESFLTLGFGGSGTDLQKGWTITDQGPQTLPDGSAQVKTEKLDLVSKDPEVKKMFSHVTIWIDPARGISLKQIFFAPNGDSRTATYSHIKLDGRVDKKPYAIPHDATVIAH
jgi:outer membrane lipoprotein-sorting protein